VVIYIPVGWNLSGHEGKSQFNVKRFDWNSKTKQKSFSSTQTKQTKPDSKGGGLGQKQKQKTRPF